MIEDREFGSGLVDVVFDRGEACEGCGDKPSGRRDGAVNYVVRMPCGACEGHGLCVECWVGCHEAALLAEAEICDVVEGWRVAAELMT